MITRAQVLHVLSAVRDPELDEPVTELGFVEDVAIADRAIAVRLRLPADFCAAGFAFVLVDDVRAALRALRAAPHVDVSLHGHDASAEINAAVREQRGFRGTPPDQDEGGLASLRTLFRRSALTARQGRACERLLADGRDVAELASMRLADLPDGSHRDRCVELRRALGLPATPDAPAFLAPEGRLLDAAGLDRHVRISQVLRSSVEDAALATTSP
jgi:metal-sulfur cluster biosynthetic enzyme